MSAAGGVEAILEAFIRPGSSPEEKSAALRVQGARTVANRRPVLALRLQLLPD